MHKLQIRKIKKVRKYKDRKLQKYNKCLETASGNWPGGWEPQSAIRRCTVAPRHLARPENFTFEGDSLRLLTFNKKISKVRPTLPIFSLVSCFCVSDSTDDSSSAIKNSESTFCRCYIFLCQMLFVAGTQLQIIVSVYVRWLAALSLLPEVHDSLSFSENTTACTETFVICGCTVC